MVSGNIRILIFAWNDLQFFWKTHPIVQQKLTIFGPCWMFCTLSCFTEAIFSSAKPNITHHISNQRIKSPPRCQCIHRRLLHLLLHYAWWWPADLQVIRSQYATSFFLICNFSISTQNSSSCQPSSCVKSSKFWRPVFVMPVVKTS